MVERAQHRTRPIVTAIVLALSALALLGNAVVSLLPRPTDFAPRNVLTTKDLVVAYGRIQPGRTRASELSQYGFDTASTAVQMLSYLGLMERFIPHDSVRFDRLDSAIKDCVAVRDHCTALVFRSVDHTRNMTARGFFTAFGLDARAAAVPPQVTFLIRDGRVAFKTISGVAEVTHIAARDRQARAIPVPFRMSY